MIYRVGSRLSAEPAFTARGANSKYTVAVLDRLPFKNPRKAREWALVWTSRPGIAAARVADLIGDRSDPSFISVLIEPVCDFDRVRDYMVVERHQEYKNPGGKRKEIWQTELLIGTPPRWVEFPKEWKAWVSDASVRMSAIAYIAKRVPMVLAEMEAAEDACSDPDRFASAWIGVAEAIERHLSLGCERCFELGWLATHWRTAMLAIAIRIASRLSSQSRFQWTPPIPQPVWEDPDKSGRYLLANPNGPYPKAGPGVDHPPQRRPYLGIEGTLGLNGRTRAYASKGMD